MVVPFSEGKRKIDESILNRFVADGEDSENPQNPNEEYLKAEAEVTKRVQRYCPCFNSLNYIELQDVLECWGAIFNYNFQHYANENSLGRYDAINSKYRTSIEWLKENGTAVCANLNKHAVDVTKNFVKIGKSVEFRF